MRLSLAAVFLLITSPVLASPPLESEDMATAGQGRAQFFVGESHLQHTPAGSVRREIPYGMLAMGLGERDELRVSVPYVSADGHRGIGDLDLALKYMFNYDGPKTSGISGMFDAKLRTGSQSENLGTGAVDYTGRLIAQEGWKKNKVYLNAALTWVGSPVENGSHVLRHNIRLASVGQESEVASKLTMINEMLWSSSAIPGEPYRLAANTGLRYAVTKSIELHGMIGRSLRSGNTGGPQMRSYLGVKFEFASVPPDAPGVPSGP